MKKFFLSVAFLACSLVFLPGCDWNSMVKHSCTSCDHRYDICTTDDESPCCISLSGKAAVSQAAFNKKLDELCQARPDIKQALMTLPAEQQQGFFDQFADALLAEALITRYVQKMGLNATPEYKNSAAQAHAALEVQLMNNAFQGYIFKQIEALITDEIAEQYYQENRDRIAIFKRAPFIDQLGGVKILSLEGLSYADAQAIAARAEKQDFARIAQELKRTLKTYELITSRSTDVDENIRSKALGYSKASQIDVVKLANGKYAVIKSVEIIPDTFKPYADPEVKEAVRGFLMRNELGKAVAKTMEDLKQEYGAVIHRDVIMQGLSSEAPCDDQSQGAETQEACC